MTLTISDTGECQYDTGHTYWYGTCTLGKRQASDTQATNKTT